MFFRQRQIFSRHLTIHLIGKLRKLRGGIFRLRFLHLGRSSHWSHSGARFLWGKNIYIFNWKSIEPLLMASDGVSRSSLKSTTAINVVSCSRFQIRTAVAITPIYNGSIGPIKGWAVNTWNKKHEAKKNSQYCTSSDQCVPVNGHISQVVFFYLFI